MTSSQPGVQISKKAFIQAAVIILALMLLSGVLTRILPAGQFARVVVEGRGDVIQPDSFQFIDRPEYPVWRWFLAPLEVLIFPGNVTVIGIILFILLVGVAFALLERAGVLQYAIHSIVRRFGHQKYTLLLVLTFFFMALGGFFGILEEVIPLVPIVIALALSLGWDVLTGLGISILAANVGFSTAVFNFFTIGTAQRLAGLPLFSGWVPRLMLFIVMYLVLAVFLTRHARRIEGKSARSPGPPDNAPIGIAQSEISPGSASGDEPRLRRAALFMGAMFVLILISVMFLTWQESLSDLAMPVSGLLFLAGGVGAALMAGMGKRAWGAIWHGFLGIAPAVPLLLMAASVQLIISSGGILDTLLYYASTFFADTSPFVSVLLIYGLTLVLELFISSGSAKAFLVIPILMPLADLVGVNRQIAVSAYAFGDGFSNLVYPTNALLLIALSLTGMAYFKWLKWVLRLWVWVIPITVAFLALAVVFNYGPF
jgi:uncharacterized ion transporter superfamily protein YfcC